jgi:Fe-S oxidoreductase
MFLEMRRAVDRAGVQYPEHSVILAYEKRGTSRRYTWYAFPRDCDTVFFPGCSLSGTRPQRVKDLFNHQKKSIPNLGIVLDCCSKPSHDLGREAFFQPAFAEMKACLLENGISHVLVACPNCHKVFKDRGGELSTRTVYEFLAENDLPKTPIVSDSITIHDPCPVRFEESILGVVRTLAERTGLRVEEMRHHGKETFCCGEGGAVGFLSPELAKNWSVLLKNEAQGRRIVSYCAGCVNNLGRITPTAHLLDLLFEPKATLSGTVSVSRGSITYWNRLQLKRWFKKNLNGRVTRERTSRIM